MFVPLIQGAMKAAISTRDLDPDSLIDKAKKCQGIVGIDLVKEVTCKRPMLWQKEGPVELNEGLEEFRWPEGDDRWRVVAMDYGIKYNILRSLEKRGCNILLLPAGTGSETINMLKPHGLFLSNGPGDPSAVTYAVDTIKGQIGKRPRIYPY